MELVAEGDDKLMEEFFEKGTIPEEAPDSCPARRDPRRQDLSRCCLRPGLGNVGVDKLMDFLVDYTPRRNRVHTALHGVAGSNGQSPERHVADSRCALFICFQNCFDPFAGRISYFKVYSGVLKNDASVQNFTA